VFLKDYHWEERDIIPFVEKFLSERLVGKELWKDKNSSDSLRVTSCDVEGWAVSNVRKGSTKNVWDFSAKVMFDGVRGGTSLRVVVGAPGLDHELLDNSQIHGSIVLPPLVVTSHPSHGNVTSKKAVDENGNIVEVSTGEVEVERAMRNNEMFLKLVKKKGVPLVEECVISLLNEINCFGQHQVEHHKPDEQGDDQGN
jgi:activator of HSP90 ATPase